MQSIGSGRCAYGTDKKRNGDYGRALGIRPAHVPRRFAGPVGGENLEGRFCAYSAEWIAPEYFAQAAFSHRHKPEIVGLIDALLKRPGITQEQLEQIATLVEQRKG